MTYMYEIRKKAFDGKEDQVLVSNLKKEELKFEIDALGFSDCKNKIDENGTLLYYKGRTNAIYVAYVKEK